MASYGYPSKAYPAYNDLTPWVNYGDKIRYAPDHVCKPVVVDADGRKHPVVSYTPSNSAETRVIETQTIVMQEVRSPVVNGYGHSSPEHGHGNTGYGHVKDTPFVNGYKHSSPEHGHGNPGYGHVDDKWYRSSNPDPGRDKWYRSSSPDDGRDKWNRSSSPDDGRDKWQRSSSPDHHGRPHKVKEFLTKVQTEASLPKRFGLLSPSVWRRSPDSTGHHGHGPGHGNTGYGDYSDKSSKDGHKPSVRNGDYDNYYHNNGSRTEPTVTNSGGWTRPTRAGWGVPPDASLSSPTNDINTAVRYLQEGARPTSVTTAPQSRVTVPITTGPRRDDYGQTIDSREAARRYGNLGSSPVPEERYTGTIDSREAARKYRGTTV